eukprot:evm.model.NODE_51720_length_21927_cov_20.203447.2
MFSTIQEKVVCLNIYIIGFVVAVDHKLKSLIRSIARDPSIDLFTDLLNACVALNHPCYISVDAVPLAVAQNANALLVVHRKHAGACLPPNLGSPELNRRLQQRPSSLGKGGRTQKFRVYVKDNLKLEVNTASAVNAGMPQSTTRVLHFTRSRTYIAI